jgi:hypothetical protein
MANLIFVVLKSHFHNPFIRFNANGSPLATKTYCHDETDPMALCGVSDFVADYEIGKFAKWRMGALGKTASFDLFCLGSKRGWVGGALEAVPSTP